MNKVTIPVSVGELFDKITILKIKQEKIKNTNKLINVSKELLLLECISQNINHSGLEILVNKLKEINLLLWCVEDKIRIKEKQKCYDQEFVELARNVYFYNDKRSEIKREINIITNSDIIEEKYYQQILI